MNEMPTMNVVTYGEPLERSYLGNDYNSYTHQSITIPDLLRDANLTTITTTEGANMAEPTKRLVRVLLVDPDGQVPVEKSILHDGKEQLTDATDDELFFEIDMKAALEKHNVYRQTLRDKDVTDREEFLEPARIRDLSMFVVTIASF